MLPTTVQPRPQSPANDWRHRRSRAAWIPPTRRALVAAWTVALVAGPAAAQWSAQSPVPTYLDARGTAAPTTQRVFVATDDNSFDEGGALWESTDGGATWAQRDVPFNLHDPLNGITFLDSQLGWAYGNANYRTTDGGTTWEELPFLGSTYFMRFYHPGFGYASTNGDGWVSYDGGLNWITSPEGLFAFDFASPTAGLGVAEVGVYRTTDGGVQFNQVYGGAARAVLYLTSAVAVAIADSTFVRSTDGGIGWTAGEGADGRTQLVRISDTEALAYGRGGSFPDFDDRMFRTSDGGLTWTDLGEIMPEGVHSLVVTAPATVVGADLSGNLFRSTDGGQTWTQTFASPGPRPGFLGSTTPVFPDAQTGYFAFGAGYVVKTNDGGASWEQVSSGYGASLHDIAMLPGGELVAVGEGGTVLASSGGPSWTLQPPFTTLDLVAADVAGPQSMVIVDQVGGVHRSTDGGATWTAGGSTPPNLDAGALDFATPTDGWVAGTGAIGGAVFHTEDGGDSWTAAPGFGGLYTAIDFEGAHGWAANASGVFQKTTDSGASWTEHNLPGSPLNIKDMDFFDHSTGYAVGSWGFAARTDDGGDSWQPLVVPDPNHNFVDIHLLSANEFWLTTSDDVAYYTASGGATWAVLEIGSAGFGSFTSITANAAGDAWAAGFLGDIQHFAGPPPPPDNQPPIASFDFEAEGLTVVLTDTSTDVDGTITSWAWEFGDSTFSTEQHPVHTYEEADTYIVRLTVTDDDGATDSGVRFITVQPNPGGTFGDFTEVTPLDPLFVTPQDEDFWVTTTAPADYDNDGDLDIAVLGFYVVYNVSVDYRLVLLRNDGEAGPEEWEFAYEEVELGDTTAGASDLAWADIDGDGDQDLAVGSNGATVLYKNDGGVLTATDSVLPGYYEDNDQADFDLRSITWADYDNDGDPDLLLPSVYADSTFSFRTALLRNDGQNGTGGWTFTETDSVFAATIHAQSSWADFDGDQDLDLLLVHLAPLTETGFIRRYRNDGGGVFVGEDILGSLSIEHGEAQWGDYDADGDLDILVAGNLREVDGTYTAAALRLYRNDAETFVPIEIIECVPCEGWFDLNAATWADYDTDGDVDILVAGSYNSGSQIEGRSIIYDNVAGVFVPTTSELPAPRSSGPRGGTFSWLDLDGDQDLDYFVAGQYWVPGGNGLVEAQMHAYRNDAMGQNFAPSTPTGLGATVNGHTVHLQWQAAGDDHTPVAALTYDLQVLQSGLPVGGAHRLPEPGAAGGTAWTLTHLADGAYTWTLRAVDAAYAGSVAAEGTFVVGNTAAVQPASQLPRALALAPAAPNPFNPVTTLRFTLPEPTDIRLDVYDTTGRLVERLVDGRREAGVYYERWDAQGLASGVYVVRLEAGTLTRSRQITLVK